jgi:DNA-binding PadR family transcriptional regulator
MPRHHDEPHERRGAFHGPHHEGRGGEHRGGRRHGGRGIHRMERGALRFVLLDSLRGGPQHGYEMIKALEERTHGQYAPRPGALYPTLQYLADLGLIRATQEGDRRVYELTESGRTEAEAQQERVAAFWARFAAEAASEASRHEVTFLQDELEDLAHTVWSGLREAIHRGDQETIRRARRAVEQCQEEIRRLIAAGPAAPGEGAV